MEPGANAAVALYYAVCVVLLPVLMLLRAAFVAGQVRAFRDCHTAVRSGDSSRWRHPRSKRARPGNCYVLVARWWYFLLCSCDTSWKSRLQQQQQQQQHILWASEHAQETVMFLLLGWYFLKDPIRKFGEEKTQQTSKIRNSWRSSKKQGQYNQKCPIGLSNEKQNKTTSMIQSIHHAIRNTQLAF